MRQAVLLGKPDTKRSDYMGRAAREVGLHVLFLDWDGWREHFPEGRIFLKIDPPVWDSCQLGQLGSLVEGYQEQLRQLEKKAQGQDVKFLNHPKVIRTLLNKRKCKEKLVSCGLPVTEELWGENCGPKDSQLIRSVEQLLEVMRKTRVYQVFIKPVFGSGAAGVSAFRWQPRTGQMVLYTCMWEDEKENRGGELFHTKKLRRITDSGQILSLVEKLLKLGCMVERWYAKEEYKGFSYDLRAVVQEGRVDYCLARLSKGPVTNLHLNNHPLEFGELGLPGAVREQVEELCWKASGCFPGLRTVGVDILLERGRKCPRIIEMNGQGDLIYQDIYGDNRIYRRQAEMIKQEIRK